MRLSAIAIKSTCAFFFLAVLCGGPAASAAPQGAVQQGARPGETARAYPQVLVKDVFGRPLNGRGITLVDWDGHLANPALEFFVLPPRGALFPAAATLTADGVRLYFDEPSQAGQAGPSKTLSFSDAAPRAARLSVFPDRDSADELYRLAVLFKDGAGKQSHAQLDVRVIDQDAGAAPAFAVHVDFSEDLSGFYGGQQERDIMLQAAADWAYFIDDLGLDTVASGTERTLIWNYPLAWTPGGGYHYVWNSFAYEGFLLYSYGIDTPELRSGGEPSLHDFQHSGGAPLPLRRSGGVEIEVKGNWNTLGWFLTLGDDDWWVSRNLGNEPNDLYSIARHEFGHALTFNSGYPNFAAAESKGYFDDPAVVQYHGSTVPVNSQYDHFVGVVDRLSGRGIFGNEYGGAVPARRWLLTKLDLLLMQAVGYPLRETSCLVPLAVVKDTLAGGAVARPYTDGLEAEGGIPFYDWTLDSGRLPPGLALDRFSGTVSGIPSEAGFYAFTIRVRDYDLDAVPVQTSITIQ